MSNRPGARVARELARQELKAMLRIYLTQGPFQVCDGHGFDQAYDCNLNPISRSWETAYSKFGSWIEC